MILEDLQEEKTDAEKIEEADMTDVTETAEAAEVTEAAEAVEAAEAADEAEDKKPQTPTLSYFIRILCGGYLVYLSYGLFNGEGEKKPLILGAAALFALVGIFFVAISVVGLLKKKD